MYRQVILDFLAIKHKELQKAKYLQMTICEIGRNYHNCLAKLIKKEDTVKIYHVNEPRIYEKEYDFSLLNNSIVMMALELKQEITFNYQDLNFELIDPFYLKDIKNIKFSSLQVTPIMNDGEIVGVVIVYFDTENQKVLFQNHELNRLLKNIVFDVEQSLQMELEKKITQYDNYYVIAKSKSLIYLNNLVKEYLKIGSNVLTIKETTYIGRINAFISQVGIKKMSFEGLDIYYLNKIMTICAEPTKMILALYNLNETPKNEDFSFLLVRFPISDNMKKNIQDMNDIMIRLEIDEYSIYQYNDETYIYLINGIIASFDYEKIKNNYKDYYFVLLTSKNDLTKQMNLKKLSDYLYNIQPEKYSYKDYIEWLKNNHEESLSFIDKYNDNTFKYEIINSSDQETLGSCFNLPLKVANRDGHFTAYNEMSERILKSCLKCENQKIILHLSSTSLAKRKVLEEIKKIINNGNHLWINVLDDKKINQDDFLKLISKYKCLNLHLSCDSSVYLNYLLMTSLPLFDAIYLQNEEYESIRKNEVGMPQAIMSFAISDAKYLIIENFHENQDLDYCHASCYYVKLKQ